MLTKPYFVPFTVCLFVLLTKMEIKTRFEYPCNFNRFIKRVMLEITWTELAVCSLTATWISVKTNHVATHSSNRLAVLNMLEIVELIHSFKLQEQLSWSYIGSLNPIILNYFWATVCITVRPVLSVCCLSCLWRWCTVAKRLHGSRWNLAQR